jgi:hypothetical protein
VAELDPTLAIDGVETMDQRLAQSVGDRGAVLGGFAASRALGALLWGTAPVDPAVYGANAALLLGVVIIAGWIPARRAVRIDPMIVLRAE